MDKQCPETHVICPGCVHVFDAIPVATQQRIAELEEALQSIHDCAIYHDYSPEELAKLAKRFLIEWDTGGE